MQLNLNFEICQIDCDRFQFTDTTCFHNYFAPYTCTDGYNVPGSVDVNDLGKTLFTWIMPDNSIVTDVDLGYQVGTKARFYLTLSAGTLGTSNIEVNGILIGSTLFNTDLSTTLNALMSSINSTSTTSGWQMYILTGLDFVIEAVDYGLTFNNKILTFVSSNDIAFTFITNVSTGANGFTDTFCFGMAEIYGLTCSDTPIPCGVHRITYKIFDKFDVEVKRVTKYILVDWRAKNAIKSWIMLSTEGNCCGDDKIDERVLELRLYIEKAQVQFENYNYTCAQKTIDKMKKLASNICLDC